MISRLSREAEELGQFVFDALSEAGGVDIMRRAIARPADRKAAIEDLLAPFGVWELSVRTDQTELEAAAVVARAAGRVALPYPVAERLAAPAGSEALMLAPGPDRHVALHADLDLEWTAVTLRGEPLNVVSTGDAPLGTKLGNFVAAVQLTSAIDGSVDMGRRNAALLVTLQGWWLQGVLARALDDTAIYVQQREQFGRRLAAFQSVGFCVADMSVALHKLEELAKYALWSQSASDGDTALVDALALRAAGLEAAETVFRGAHQLHGAIGFCDETDVSLLSRASQPVRRLPIGAEQTYDLLTDLILNGGLASPFSDTAELS